MKNIHTLYDKLSIENWILPACFLGVIDTVVWVAPPWSHQIPEGQYDFVIGRHNRTNKVRHSGPENLKKSRQKNS